MALGEVSGGPHETSELMIMMADPPSLSLLLTCKKFAHFASNTILASRTVNSTILASSLIQRTKELVKKHKKCAQRCLSRLKNMQTRHHLNYSTNTSSSEPPSF